MSTTTDGVDGTKLEHGWLQFRLRSFFLVTLALGILLVWVGRATRQSIAVSRIYKSGGVAEYEFLLPVPSWCIDWFGRDLFARVTSITYFEHGAFPPHAPENHRNYAALCDLPHIKELRVFDSPFPCDVLEDMTTLQHLAIDVNGLRDDDIRAIAKLHSLRTLSLTLNDITDSGAEQLSDLHHLTELDLSGNHVSDEAISDLQLSLPKCRIKNSWCRTDSQ